MRVTILDRVASLVRQDLGEPGVAVLRDVEIADRCPTCGAARGVPRRRVVVVEGAQVWLDEWRNPCGHIDHYAGVLIEAGLYGAGERVRNRQSPLFGRQLQTIINEDLRGAALESSGASGP